MRMYGDGPSWCPSLHMPLFDGECGRLIYRDAIDNAVDNRSFPGQNIITKPTM